MYQLYFTLLNLHKHIINITILCFTRVSMPGIKTFEYSYVVAMYNTYVKDYTILFPHCWNT